jgi:beta-mannosidase
LRIALYRNQETLVDEVRHPLILEGHSVWEEDLERLLGRFVDASWAYRFGPPAQDLIVLSLESEDGLLAQSVRFPAGRPVGDLTADALGLEATLESVDAERVRLLVRTRRLAYSVRIHVPGFMPDDNAFALEPGRWRGVDLLRVASGPWPGPPAGHLTAMNLIGRFPLRSEDEPV